MNKFISKELYCKLVAIDLNLGNDMLLPIINLLIDKEIPISMQEIHTQGVFGATLKDRIVINSFFLMRFDDNFSCTETDYSNLIFGLLHETAHFMRIAKGKGGDINSHDFKEFFDTILEEERVANKYALIMYHKLLGERCSSMDFQLSTFYNNIPRMKNMYRGMHQAMVASGKDYFEFFEDMIS